MGKSKSFFKTYFIDTLTYMSLGLFSTLIIGSILNQIGVIFNISFFTDTIYPALRVLTAPVIAMSVAYGLKADPLVIFASGCAGYIGSDPVSALIAGIVASLVGGLVSKKTKVDIIITPLLTILASSIVAAFIGPYMAQFLAFIGSIITWATNKQPFIMGIIIAVVMGIALTLPISSAAIGIMLNLNGIAAGAACVGCACHMVGFAVMSFKENGFSGLLAQGLGTSMLQISNLMKKPILWIPPIVSSVILGPISTVIFKMPNTAYGAGMGTSGLVGQFGAYEAMGSNPFSLGVIVLMHFVLPGIITLAVSTYMRKKDFIKSGDLKLDI